MSLTIIGRSSSHFTRVARIFALEMRVDCSLQVVPDLAYPELNQFCRSFAVRASAEQTTYRFDA